MPPSVRSLTVARFGTPRTTMRQQPDEHDHYYYSRSAGPTLYSSHAPDLRIEHIVREEDAPNRPAAILILEPQQPVILERMEQPERNSGAQNSVRPQACRIHEGHPLQGTRTPNSINFGESIGSLSRYFLSCRAR
jgi:hypothetical protein